MTRKTLSRRDAIKLLGAATGAALLANLPSKWSTPELTSSVLPVHAQTSCTGLTMQITAISGLVGLAIFTQSYPPDQTTGSGGVGTIYSWDCRLGCIEINAGAVGSSSGSVDVLFTTPTNSQTVQYVLGSPHFVYVNFGTGIISVDDSGSGAGCA